MIFCKRVYDEIAETDGYRVLVDRLWPRGIKKTDLHYDEWNKGVAPDTELRKWFHAIPLFIQTAGSLAALSQPGHILMYAPRLSSLSACLHLE